MRGCAFDPHDSLADSTKRKMDLTCCANIPICVALACQVSSWYDNPTLLHSTVSSNIHVLLSIIECCSCCDPTLIVSDGCGKIYRMIKCWSQIPSWLARLTHSIACTLNWTHSTTLGWSFQCPHRQWRRQDWDSTCSTAATATATVTAISIPTATTLTTTIVGPSYHGSDSHGSLS